MIAFAGRLAQWTRGVILDPKARAQVPLPEMATIEVIVESALLMGRLQDTSSKRRALTCLGDAPWKHILSFIQTALGPLPIGTTTAPSTAPPVYEPCLGNPHWRTRLAEVLVMCFTDGMQVLGTASDQELLLAMEGTAPPGCLEHLLDSSCGTPQAPSTLTVDALCESLIRLFCAVERTGAAGQFYEKFHQRYLLAVLLRTLWANHAAFRSSLLALSLTTGDLFIQ